MSNPYNPTHKPDIIFVVGNSRSGTTMMGRILALHPEVFTFHELHFFEQLWSVKDKDRAMSFDEASHLYAQLINNQRSGLFTKKNIDTYLSEARKTLNKSVWSYTPHTIFEFFLKNESQRNGKSIACEQTPRNILYVNEILELYPHAKIIGMVRDPRDVLLSQKRKWKRKFLGATNIPLSESIRSWVNYHSITISKIWQTNSLILKRYSNHPFFLSVRFEDLIHDPQTSVREICTFLGLPFVESMLDVPRIGSSNSTDQSDIGISTSTTGNWKKGGLTKSEIYYCQRICQESMKRFKYPHLPVKSNLLSMGTEAISFPIKLILALGLNLGRMKNIKESIQRRLQPQQ